MKEEDKGEDDDEQNKRRKQTCKIIYTIRFSDDLSVRTDNARVTTKATREHLEGKKAASTVKSAKQSNGRAERKSVKKTERRRERKT